MKINENQWNQWKSARADGNDPRGDLLLHLLFLPGEHIRWSLAWEHSLLVETAADRSK